jgi:prepilin-type N-terminal cleavage/methylation domain-containing protein
MNQPRRAGFTLLELTISLGIFALVMSLVLDTLTNVTGYSTQESRQSDMTVSGRLATLQISNDLENSAWLYDYSATLHQFILTTMPNTVSYAPPSPYLLNPMLPYVWQDTTSTAANEKDSLEFVKIRTSTVIATSPYDEHYASLPFYNGSTLNSFTTLDQYATAPTSTLLIVNPNFPAAPGPNDIFVSHVWESSNAGLTFDQNQSPSWLRHYHLEVVKVQTVCLSPLIQTGQLVRTYWNGSGSGNPNPGNDGDGTDPTWTDGGIVPLLFDVQSFIVHTPQQEATLNGNPVSLGPNQLSFTITQAKPTTTPGIFVSHTMDFVVSMRSITRQ